MQTYYSYHGGVAWLIAALLAFGLGGCAARSPESFSAGRPIFDPGKYFAGRTHSWGVFESPSGKPTRQITTTTEGHWVGDAFHFEQDLQIEHQKSSHRSWILHRVDAHHYTGTGTGIVGTARAEAYGNLFHLEFTLDLVPGNPLLHLKMEQWMYLLPDGRTMLNRASLSKAGVIVAQVTERFQKDR
jgi:hypothetical protein